MHHTQKLTAIRILFLFALLFCFQLTQAQLLNPNLFSTATNSSGTSTLPPLSNDLNWMASLNNLNGPYIPCKVLGVNSAWAVSPYANASWVSYNHTCTPNPSEHNCDGDEIDEYYRLIFNLPAQFCGMAITTPSTYCLDLDFLADNSVNEILVNGVVNYTNTTLTPYQDSDFLATNAKSVSLCKNWSAGSNTILVHIKSGAPNPGDLVGFLAQANQTLNPGNGKGILTSGIIKNQPCPGYLSTGGATISPISWGTGPYTYSWSPTGGTTNISTPLSPGNYTCTVKSANDPTSCFYTLSIAAFVTPIVAAQNNHE